MRILIEMHNTDLRLGSVSTTLDLATQLSQRDFEFTFCGHLHPDFIKQCTSQNFQIIDMSSHEFSRGKIHRYISNAFFWYFRLASTGVNLIFQNYSGWGQSLAWAGKLRNLPVLARAGSIYDSRNPSNNLIDGYLAYNRFHARHLLDSPLASKVHLTGHPFKPYQLQSLGPCPKSENNSGNQNLNLLYLGQLTERKRLHVLINAVYKMKYRRVQLHLVGGNWTEQGYPEKIKKLIKDLNLQDIIKLENHSEDIYRKLCQSDIFVFPSVDDTHPRVILEAMFLGIPIVASRSGGIPDMIQDNETGILVPPDDPGALAVALDSLAQSPALREKIAYAARNHMIEHFESTEVLDRYEKVFRSYSSK